jgi:hypothetical protein
MPQQAAGKIVCSVISFDNNEYSTVDAEIPLQEGIPGLGMPITMTAANKMINDYIVENMNNQDQNLSIEFGKETLLYLLSQPDCASIKFYFCTNHVGAKSLVAIPMTATRQSIQISTVTANMEIAGSEVGGGETIRQFLSRNAGLQPGDISFFQ